MELIEETKLFREIRALAEKVVDFDAELPDQVFRSHIRKFSFVDVDELFTEEFYAWMIDFVDSIPEPTWNFIMKYPDPEKFFETVGKYPAFEMAIGDAYEVYWSNVGKRHSQEIHYTIYDEGTSKIVLFSRSGEWGILMDRDFELGIAGFSNHEMAAKFCTAFGDEHVFNVHQAIDMFLIPAYGGETQHAVPQSIREKLQKNYGS
jgi:hypothetical protein